MYRECVGWIMTEESEVSLKSDRRMYRSHRYKIIGKCLINNQFLRSKALASVKECDSLASFIDGARLVPSSSFTESLFPPEQHNRNKHISNHSNLHSLIHSFQFMINSYRVKQLTHQFNRSILVHTQSY